MYLCEENVLSKRNLQIKSTLKIITYLFQCDPNLEVFGVWINTLDPTLPRIALFSRRDIEKGEELTFDYMMTGMFSQLFSPQHVCLHFELCTFFSNFHVNACFTV